MYYISSKTVSNINSFANKVSSIIELTEQISRIFDEDPDFNQTLSDLKLDGNNFVFPTSVEDFQADLLDYRNKLDNAYDKIKRNTPVYIINNELDQNLPDAL